MKHQDDSWFTGDSRKLHLERRLGRVVVLIGLTMGGGLLASEDEANYFKRWLEEDVVYIVTDDERDVFLSLQTVDERERFIEGFWRRRDPDPRTSQNEMKEEHYRRIAYANENFKSGIEGWRTDRGRMYIIHGPPTSVERNPTGGTYLRPLREGGGTTAAYPFEVWYYQHLPGVGSGIQIEFVDPQSSGEYRIAMRETDKDAVFMTPGAGQTLFELDGLETRAGRIRSADMGRAIGLEGDAYGNPMSNPFLRFERYVDIQRPPAISFPDLRAAVEADIHYDQLPFWYTYHRFHYTDQMGLIPLTLALPTRELNYDSAADGGHHLRAHVEVYGRLETLGREIAYEFEDSVYSDHLWEAAEGQILYQRHLPLRAGRYKLSIVVKDMVSGKLGTKEGLVVADLKEVGKFGTSSIVLADKIVPRKPEELLPSPFVTPSDFKVYPNVQHVFTQNSPLGVYIEVYDPGVDQMTLQPHVTVGFQIADVAGTVLEEKQLGSEALRPTGSRLVLSLLWPDCQLLPGEYQLTFFFEDHIRGQTARPQVQFSVQPPREN